jgi:hypothetical protein
MLLRASHLHIRHLRVAMYYDIFEGKAKLYQILILKYYSYLNISADQIPS